MLIQYWYRNRHVDGIKVLMIDFETMLEARGKPVSEQVLQVEEEVDERTHHEYADEECTGSYTRLGSIVQYWVYVSLAVNTGAIYTIVDAGKYSIGAGKEHHVYEVEQVNWYSSHPHFE